MTIMHMYRLEFILPGLLSFFYLIPIKVITYPAHAVLIILREVIGPTTRVSTLVVVFIARASREVKIGGIISILLVPRA